MSGFDLPPHGATKGRKVDIFMIGASKCGTTSLAAWLDALGPISTGSRKEPRYFSNRRFTELPTEKYHQNYDPKCPIWLDASTSYSEVWQERHVRSAARIYTYRPNARILFLVRHPMARMISEWRQFVYLLDANNDTITQNYGVRNLGTFSQDIGRFPGLIENSRFTTALAPFRERFPSDQILVMRMEDLLAGNVQQLMRLGVFLGLDDAALAALTLEHRNPGSIKGRANHLGRLLRRIPGVKRLGARLPLSVKEVIRPLIKRDPNTGLDLDAECIDICRAALQADTRTFLACWGFDPAAYDNWNDFVSN